MTPSATRDFVNSGSIETAVAVVGGGQAGLSISWYLKRHHIDHVVIERHRIAHDWRERRWDSFCLVTPNWQCQLPGHPYAGHDPDGFMTREQVVQYIESYAALVRPPLLEGVSAERLTRCTDGRFEILTSRGPIRATQVVVATGPYHVPVLPGLASAVPQEWTSIHSSRYRRPSQLPPGDVLVVGSGQSGCQIAEDLHLAGRKVHLAVGSAPRVARRYRGKDVVAWLHLMGYYETTVETHQLGESVRRNVNHYVTGRDGGHDIDLRAFALDGMELYGRLVGAGRETLRFAGDLAERLDHADSVSASIKDSIDAFIERSGINVPTEERYVPVWQPAPGPRTLDLANSAIRSVIWATGFRPDYSWIHVDRSDSSASSIRADGAQLSRPPSHSGRGQDPEHDPGQYIPGAALFDRAGLPIHRRGVTKIPGLYFLGLPWLHTWGSGRLSGVGTDAEHISRFIVELGQSGQGLSRSA